MLGASGGQCNRKILKVNANNRSERAEQEKYQSEMLQKNRKLYLTRKWQDTREAVRAGNNLKVVPDTN
jgi:hypothetical protein